MAPRIPDSSAARLIVSIDSVSLSCDRLIHNHDSKQYASCQQTGGWWRRQRGGWRPGTLELKMSHLKCGFI